MEVFEEWFQFVCFPYLKTLEGPRVVLGDNLGSHISPKDVRMCDEKYFFLSMLPGLALSKRFGERPSMTGRTSIEDQSLRHVFLDC
jgi:hypothetical protein